MSGRAGARAHGTDGPTCESARRLLWPLDRPRPWTAREEPAREHLRRCVACHAFFQADATIGRSLRGSGAASRAHPELRERVFDALARERSLRPVPLRRSGDGETQGRWPRRAVGIAGALGAAGTAALAAALLTLGPAPSESAEPFVQDFMARAVEEETVERPDPRSISRFFLRELGMPVHAASLDGARVRRVMICIIRGRRAAMIEYEMKEGETIAHYRLPHVSRRSPGDARPGRGGLRVWTEGGISVARWNDTTFEHALVAALPESQLRELARQAAGGP